MATPSIRCLFVSDLHGRLERYRSLFLMVRDERPAAVFLGGDLLPSHLLSMSDEFDDFINDFLAVEFRSLQRSLGERYPKLFFILGNDDARAQEADMVKWAERDLWQYVHNCRAPFGPFLVYGYSFVPPTPFQLKDWERYDVSRFVDPGCSHPYEGYRTLPQDERELRQATIADDLKQLVREEDLSSTFCLFHAPPYQTHLDRAALDGHMVDAAPLDVHVGSIAIRRFIESRQPLVTLHGHVHESARITGSWKEKIGRTMAFSAAHDGPELAVIQFDPGDLESATRLLI